MPCLFNGQGQQLVSGTKYKVMFEHLKVYSFRVRCVCVCVLYNWSAASYSYITRHRIPDSAFQHIVCQHIVYVSVTLIILILLHYYCCYCCRHHYYYYYYYYYSSIVVVVIIIITTTNVSIRTIRSNCRPSSSYCIVVMTNNNRKYADIYK